MPSDEEKPPPRSATTQTYTFRVTYLNAPGVWRTVEVATDQSLEDLHAAIQYAAGFDFDHLYSFFLSGRAWDEESEYAAPHAGGRSAARAKLRDLDLQIGQRFLYLFDYGDEHRFAVCLVSINPEAPKGPYPRVVDRHGENPPQYPEADEDEEDWEEWEEEGESEEEWEEEEEWDEEDV